MKQHFCGKLASIERWFYVALAAVEPPARPVIHREYQQRLQTIVDEMRGL